LKKKLTGDLKLKLNNISISFNENKLFDNFSYEFPSNKITAILGPSGCGKTTLLRIISNLLKPDSGEVIKDENENFSYIFQEPRLLPWKTAIQNCDLILKNAIQDPLKRKLIINKYLEIVKMSEYAGMFPAQLSGGMKQRISLVRAFAYPSSILLMDEPFQAIDLKLKLDLVKDFNKIWIEDKRTTLFVTHDIHEALILGDKILIIKNRPAEIVTELTNIENHDERTLSNPDIINLEKSIYKILLD